MNSKFFDVKKEKQDSIINAALRVFTVKGYKDASTDVIVKEAGISKGLLFHYFISKQGLYEFICDYSSKYMTLELTRSVKSTERDFFVILSQIEMGRCRVARNYPYMHQFLRSAKYEKEPEAVAAMGDSLKDIEITYSNIYSQINPKKFINPQDSSKVIEIIDWINDGFMKSKLSNENLTPDELNEEFAVYLDLLRRHFYKSEEDSNLSIAKEEIYERDETIMDSMRMEMTFEERLQAGKRPLVELTEEELAKLAEEEAKRAKEEKEKLEAEKEDGASEASSEASNLESTTETSAIDSEDNSTSEATSQDADPASVSIVTSNILMNTTELPVLNMDGAADTEDGDEEFFDDEDEEEPSESEDEKVVEFVRPSEPVSLSHTEPILPTFEAKSVIVSKPLNPTVVVDESRREETIEDIISEAENNLKDNSSNN